MQLQQLDRRYLETTKNISSQLLLTGGLSWQAEIFVQMLVRNWRYGASSSMNFPER